MTVKLYTLTSNTSSRKVKAHLEDHGIEHTTQNMDNAPLSWEQLLEILMYTDNGVEDIISYNSKSYIDLTKQGVNFEELSLTELHNLVVEFPRLIKAPIVITKNSTMVGFNEETTSILKSREDRKREYEEILKQFEVA